MAKARLYFDGDNTYIEKQARIYKMVDEIGEKIDNIPGVVNNLNSTSETDALSAAMGKELQDQINAMSGNFHFLSSWDCTTGLPGSDPATDPYTYQSGDYYIVSNTGSTNYKPHGSSYTHGVASTAVETQPVQMNDWYVYDGSTWILQPSGGAQIVVDTALSTTSTNPVENRVITQALNNKQNTISNLSTIETGAALGATALQPGDNITQLTNNAGYQTAGDVASAIIGKQDVLTAGEGIDITNNIVTNTGITSLTGGTDIDIVTQVGRGLPTGYTELEYIQSSGTQYIDTGIVGNVSSTRDLKSEVVVEYPSAPANDVCTLGCRTGSIRIYMIYSYTGWCIGYNTTYNTAYGIIPNIKYTTKTAISTSSQTLELNGSNIISQTDDGTTTTDLNMYLFACNMQGTAGRYVSAKIYSTKIRVSDVLSLDLVPCVRNNDSAVGMYDMVSNTFFANSGSGTFTTGPVVQPGTVINFTNDSGYMLKSSNKLIYATTDTAFNTRDKICTTADGNYTPREGDVLALVFNNGCGVGSPRLDIDGSGLHSISVSTTGANAATFWLGMDKITWLFVYDGNRWITWPIKDTTYSAGTGLSLSSGVFSNTQPGPTIGTTAPATPAEGAMWYDTTNHVLKVYNGTEWTEVGSGGGGGSTTWGNIGGILSNQTDLQDALDEKLESTDLIAGDGINIQAVGSELPSGYTQLAYIQLNGTQALDTGITGIGKSIEVDTQCTNPSASGWQIISSYGEDYLGMFFGAIGGSWAVQNSTAGKIAGVTVSDRNILTGKFSLPNNQNKVELTVSGNTVTYTRTAAARPDANIHLGGAISTTNTLLYPYSGYIYGARIYDTATNVDVARYIPCQNISSIPGLYDTVSGTFFPATKGTFIAGPAVQAEGIEISVDDSVWTDDNIVAGTGITIDTGTSARLPSGYTEVEWIQSGDNCALDSGITLSQIDRSVIVGNFVQNNGGFRSVLGADNQNASTNAGKYAIVLGEGSGGQYYSESIIAASGAVDYVYSSVAVNTSEHTFTTYWSSNALYLDVDGIVDTQASSGKSTGVTTTLGIFARHLQASNTFASTSSIFKMKSMQLYSGINLVFNGVPCKRDSDDEIGLYDLVSNTFLENQGSGTFTAGPVVTFDPTKIISSTVLGFNNLTYDSFTSGTWTANATVTFPTTAKMAFLNWRAKSTASGTPPFACGQVLLVRGLTLVSSFVGGGNGTDYIYGGVGLDSASTYVDYTQASKTSGAAGIDYTIYFFK